MIVDFDLPATAKRARALLEKGRYGEAAQLYRELSSYHDTIDAAYDDWLAGLAVALAQQQQRRQAAYVYLYLGRHPQALDLLDLQAHGIDRARMEEAQGRLVDAGKLYAEAGCLVQAAIALERAGELAADEERSLLCQRCGGSNATLRGPSLLPICARCNKRDPVPDVDPIAATFGAARRCWERLRGAERLRGRTYEEALVCFNLGTCLLHLGDEGGQGQLVASQRLLEEAADGFETAGQRERAFDCYQILLELGRRSGAFENLAEGFLNCIRILKQDNLKYYALQYYEDFLREALEREEFQAAATLYREAAEYCVRTGLIYDRYYMRAAAETWIRAADKIHRQEGPAEMAENALLAAVECFNAIGDYPRIGETYGRLAGLELSARRRERYARVVERYRGAQRVGGGAAPFPEYLRQPHAYPDIWYLDLVEWEHDGDAVGVCGAVVGDRRYPDVVRRRALNLLLRLLEGAGSTAEGMARIAEDLGGLQIYAVLSVLEKLYEQGEPQVQRGVMQALRFLFFKRSFGVLARGLAADDAGVREAAIDSLGRLHFNHAFDPLVRIFRETSDQRVRRTALQSIGQIPQLAAGDFLVEVLRYEPEPLRGEAKQLLTNFQNREIFPILRQYCEMEAGPARADLEEILRRVGMV